MQPIKKPVSSGNVKKGNEAQFARTRANKIRRIEREFKKHPNTANNKKMMDRLKELKEGKN